MRPVLPLAHGEGAPNMALDAQGKQEMEELYRVAQQFGLTPTKTQPNAVAILRGCAARQAQAAASTMTTPPSPPPEAAPPAPEALPHNPSATIDNVDISTSRTEKSSPKRQPSPAEEEQPRKHRRRQRSRAADDLALCRYEGGSPYVDAQEHHHEHGMGICDRETCNSVQVCRARGLLVSLQGLQGTGARPQGALSCQLVL